MNRLGHVQNRNQAMLGDRAVKCNRLFRRPSAGGPGGSAGDSRRHWEALGLLVAILTGSWGRAGGGIWGAKQGDDFGGIVQEGNWFAWTVRSVGLPIAFHASQWRTFSPPRSTARLSRGVGPGLWNHGPSGRRKDGDASGTLRLRPTAAPSPPYYHPSPTFLPGSVQSSPSPVSCSLTLLSS